MKILDDMPITKGNYTSSLERALKELSVNKVLLIEPKDWGTSSYPQRAIISSRTLNHEDFIFSRKTKEGWYIKRIKASLPTH